ncbi:MAG: formate dehydrogenase accessory protein FdhE [Burkholderiaceae bacterium]
MTDSPPPSSFPSPASSSSSSGARAGATRLLSPEQIAVKAGHIVPFLRLPDPARAYAERAERLEMLADGHPIGDYLRFVARIAAAQQRLADRYPELPLPDADAIAAAADAIAPPVPADGWSRSPRWIDGLRELLGDVHATQPAGPARELIGTLRATPAEHLQSQADRVLNGVTFGLDLASAPLIAAGLQVYWTTLVARTAAAHGADAFGRTRRATRCPCCGSAPVASIARIGAEQAGTRYLHCSLCAAQWHMVRVKCAHCESTKGIHYQELSADDGPRSGGIDGSAGRNGAGASAASIVPGNHRNAKSAAVKAECCDECGHYLKIVYMERDPAVEPVADDLATLSLDLLLTESGRQPAGVNPMLWFGDSDEDGRRNND